MSTMLQRAGNGEGSTVLKQSPYKEKPRSFDRLFRTRLNNKMFRIICFSSIALLCIVLFSIILFIGRTGILAFQSVPAATFFLSTNWTPEDEQFGAGLFIYGTLALTALTLLISTPISVGIAVFLSEIAPDWVKKTVRPILDLLVGIPSVVYGYLGLTVLIPFLQNVFGQPIGEGLLAAALVLTLMTLPTIARVSDDSIVAVPKKYRDAAYALGSTRLQVITKIVLPAANRGIMSAVILGMARAIGETMAVVMVIGNSPIIAEGLFGATSVLTSNIVMQIMNVAFDSTWNYALYMMAFLLLLISLILIILIRVIRPKGEVNV
ncbi:phosphate ABC transporter permease [Paenibacillus swuensis]|uniref:Phosphate transport system permease protein n=1 Tax=Paenibacillus swuensis TaxID=1178515 RepID=A0A172TP58_9BACL|nr:phosphate ABC transporter permease subunit PstC [Paenibacillus swuensis]ANE48533.1 phosphate ABC transporter permease [Paenibacillus swuensis]